MRRCYWSPAILFAVFLLGLIERVEAATVKLVDRPDLGVTVIHLQGGIVKGDAKRIQALASLAASSSAEGVVFVSFHSPGGQVVEGMQIGQLLRERNPRTLAALTCSNEQIRCVQKGYVIAQLGANRIRRDDAHARRRGRSPHLFR